MNIGIDLDDTLCDTKVVYMKYLKKFLFEKSIDVFSFNSSQCYKEEFYKTYLSIINKEVKVKSCAKDVIKYLKDKRCSVFVITNRSGKYLSNVYEDIENYLFVNEIKVDGIFCVDDNKISVCVENNIDYMIDDNKEICDSLSSSGIGVILFDEIKQYDFNGYSVSCWLDIKKIFELKLK